MHTDIRELLLKVISGTLENLGYKSFLEGEIPLDYPTDSRFGDLTTNLAMRLAKPLKKAPRAVAEELIPVLKINLEKDGILGFVKEIKIEGAGFINFYLNGSYFYERLKDLLISGKEALRLQLGKGKNVLIEFVSANPTGSLSVAHARQAAVGDSLANILNFTGCVVSREYYLNDEGNQINILGNSVGLRMRQLKGEKIEFPENYYQGDYIYDIARIAMEKNIPEQGMGDFAANYILEIIKKELDDFGVKFDTWFSQKDLTIRGKIEEAFALLKEKGFLYEEEGALWFKSTSFADDKDRVVIKSDGAYTYLAPDIAYHQEKFLRGFNYLINLWGPDHHGYINRLKASVEAFGRPADSLAVVIVQLATIFRDGKPVQMSTRRGEYITLREVLNEVGADAARFFFLMRRTSSHLDFDLDVAKKQTSENPVYYVQYAHARISSILRSLPQKPDFNLADLTFLKEKEELDLIRKIFSFSSVLIACYATLDPYQLTIYLQELAESFHKFYDRHRVLNQEPQLTEARLSLIEGTRIAISAGLGLLGVSSPDKM